MAKAQYLKWTLKPRQRFGILTKTCDDSSLVSTVFVRLASSSLISSLRSNSNLKATVHRSNFISSASITSLNESTKDFFQRWQTKSWWRSSPQTITGNAGLQYRRGRVGRGVQYPPPYTHSPTKILSQNHIFLSCHYGQTDGRTDGRNLFSSNESATKNSSVLYHFWRLSKSP